MYFREKYVLLYSYCSLLDGCLLFPTRNKIDICFMDDKNRKCVRVVVSPSSHLNNSVIITYLSKKTTKNQRKMYFMQLS